MPLLALVRERGGEALRGSSGAAQGDPAREPGARGRGECGAHAMPPPNLPRARRLAREKDVLAGIEMAGLFRLHDACRDVADDGRVERGPRGTSGRGDGQPGGRLDPSAAVAILAGVLRDATVAVSLREQAANGLARLNRPEAQAELLGGPCQRTRELADHDRRGAGRRPGGRERPARRRRRRQGVGPAAPGSCASSSGSVLTGAPRDQGADRRNSGAACPPPTSA